MEDIDIKMNDADDINEEVEDGFKGDPEVEDESVLGGMSDCGKEQIVDVCFAMDKLKDLVLDLLKYFPEYMPRSEEKKLLDLPFQDKRVLDEKDCTELKNVLEIRMYGQEYENFGLPKLEFSLEETKDTENKLENMLTKICTLNEKLIPYVEHVKKKVDRKKASDEKKDQQKGKTEEGWGGKKRDPQTKDTTKYPIKGLTDKDVSPIRGEFDMMRTLQKVEKSKDEKSKDGVSREKNRLSRKDLDIKKKNDENERSPIREGFNMRNLIRREEFERAKSEGSNEKLDLLESAIQRLKSNIQAGVKEDKQFDLTKDYEFFMGMFNAEAKKWNMDEKMEHIQNFDVSEFVTTKFSSDEMYKIEERIKRINKYNSTIENEYSIQHPIEESKGDAPNAVKEKSVRRNRAEEGDLLDEVLKLKGKQRGRRSISPRRRSRRRSWSRGRSGSRRSISRGRRSRSRGRRSRSRGRRSRSRGRRSRSRGYVAPFGDVQPGVGAFNGMIGTPGIPNIAAGNMGLTLDGLQNYIAGLQNLVAKQQTMGGHQQNYNMGQQQNMMRSHQNSMDGFNNATGFQSNMGGGGSSKNMGGIARNDMQMNLNAPMGNSRNVMGGDGWNSMRGQPGQIDQTSHNLTKYISDKLDRRQNPSHDAPFMDQTGARNQTEELVFGERLPSDRMRSETRFGPGFSGHERQGEASFSSGFPANHERREEVRFGSESNSRQGVDLRGGNPQAGHDMNSRQGVDLRGGNSQAGLDMRGGSGMSDRRGGSGVADYGASQLQSWPTRGLNTTQFAQDQGSSRMSGIGNNYKPDRPHHVTAGDEQKGRNWNSGEEEKGRNWKDFMSAPSSIGNITSGYQNNTSKPHQRY